MGESKPLFAVILIAVAMILFFAEVFVPSGGLLGLLAAAALISGIVVLFSFNTTAGVIGLIVSLAALPFLLAFALKIMPNTVIGRMLTLKNPPPRDPNDDPSVSQATVGATGQAITDLRPVGTCLIDGKRTDCLAERGVIEAGQRVRVIVVDGMQVKVRPTDDA